MNKQMMYIIRIVLGGFLAFIGIRLLIQITDQRPTDTVPLGLFAGAVIIIGAVDALFSFRKLWMMLKADDSAADREGAQGENKEQQYSETMHRKKAAMVNIMDPEHSDDETEEKRMEEKETEEKQTSDAEDEDSGSDDEKEEKNSMNPPLMAIRMPSAIMKRSPVFSFTSPVRRRPIVIPQ